MFSAPKFWTDSCKFFSAGVLAFVRRMTMLRGEKANEPKTISVWWQLNAGGGSVDKRYKLCGAFVKVSWTQCDGFHHYHYPAHASREDLRHEAALWEADGYDLHSAQIYPQMVDKWVISTVYCWEMKNTRLKKGCCWSEDQASLTLIPLVYIQSTNEALS